MICIIALIVFGILSIFSATHRKIAIEAFDCVFRRITFKKCESRLDIRLKSQIIGKIVPKSPFAAKVVYRYFELFSWFFLLLMIVSTIYVALGGYNYYLYGNCNGPNSDGFCVFDPLGSNAKYSEPSVCAATPPNPEALSIVGINQSMFPSIKRNADNTVLFIGCYLCPYTRESYPAIKKLFERVDVDFVFMHLPVKEGSEWLSRYGNCIYETSPEMLWEFNNRLFEATDFSKEHVNEITSELGLPTTEIELCSNTPVAAAFADRQLEEISKIGIYGTPTVFVNGEAVVGPKPYRVYARLLK